MLLRWSLLEQGEPPAEPPAPLGAPPGGPGELLAEAARDGDLAPGHRHRRPAARGRTSRVRGHRLPQHHKVDTCQYHHVDTCQHD